MVKYGVIIACSFALNMYVITIIYHKYIEICCLTGDIIDCGL